MSVSLLGNVVRLACDQSQSTQSATGDSLRGGSPIILWRATRNFLQGAVFEGTPNADNLVTDFTGWAAVVMVMRVGAPDGALLFAEKTLTVAQLNTALTYEDWAAGAPGAYHYQFELSSTDTNVAAQSKIWLAIGVLTTSGPYVVAYNDQVSIRDSGIPFGGDPTATLPASNPVYSQAEVDAKLAALAEDIQPTTQYTYRDYAAVAAPAVDSLLVGKTPSFTNLQGAGTQNFFSTYAPTATPPVFTRNPACIIPWPSFVSLWNSANADGTGGNRGRVTMVTPTQGLTNNHFAQPYQPGVQHIFLGADGHPYTLAVASSVQVGTSDCQVVTFTGPAPAAVGCACVFAPGMVANLFPTGTPLLSLNQQMQAVIAELISSPPAGDTTEVVVQSATAANRVAWSAPVIVGDSDSPVFVILGGTPVLLTTYHSSVGGPPIAELAAAVNARLVSGTALSVAPVNVLGAASKRDVAGGPGPVVALSANGQIDPSFYTAGTGDGGTTGVEQTWDGSANITMDTTTTVFRITATSLSANRVAKLPALGNRGGLPILRTIRVIIPAGITGTGVFYISPVSGATLTPSGILAASNNTRVLSFSSAGGFGVMIMGSFGRAMSYGPAN